MESALVPINAESQDMAHVRVRFHGADKDHVVQSGKGGEFMPVPGAGVLGNAQAAQPQAFCLKDQFFGRKAGIGAAFGCMDV